MNVLVTGAAGFIGYHVIRKFIKLNHRVFGVDNLNSYYDVNLKKSRIKNLNNNIKGKNFFFYKISIEQTNKLEKIFKKKKIDIVINLAAQAGVRYSLVNHKPYISSNIKGFVNLLELCKKYNVQHTIFASSSSIYGKTSKFKFSENDKAVSPISLYASTKRCNEIIAHSYSYLYKMKITGLRFFTVYGPWGRPDMAYFKFIKNILNKKRIQLYNYGIHTRDFSYIDHIVEGIYLVSINKLRKKIKRKQYEIYNLANGKPKTLMSFLKIIEKNLNKKANKEYIKLQDGDVERTYANVKKFILHYNLKSKIDLNTGIKRFISWYKKFYKIK